MSTQPDLFDVCAGRHKGNPQSVAANNKNAGRRIKQRHEVFSAVYNAGADGITCRELAKQWEVGMNVISGRFSELKFLKLIRPAGRRDDCAVYVASVGASVQVNR